MVLGIVHGKCRGPKVAEKKRPMKAYVMEKDRRPVFIDRRCEKIRNWKSLSEKIWKKGPIRENNIREKGGPAQSPSQKGLISSDRSAW